MSNDVVFFVPYHAKGYAHVDLIHSFSSYADVHLFVYKWNRTQQLLEEYFTGSNRIHVRPFSLDTILSEALEQQKRRRRIVVLLTASLNYHFGQSQYRYFSAIKEYLPLIIDVYSTGHCMYGCQSCAHAGSYRLPITFTNYMRTRLSSPVRIEQNIEILICPSFSSEEAPNSLLSNTEIIHSIATFSFPHVVKLHPLTYPHTNGEHPLFSLSKLEKDNIEKLLTANNVLSEYPTNTLKLIEHARLIICDTDSSIPFEALYFDDQKYILVYETVEQQQKDDDRRPYFHTFKNAQQLNHLINQYFNMELEIRTQNSHKFFLEKYDEPDGQEIQRLANERQWTSKDQNFHQNFDLETIKYEITSFIQSAPTRPNLYASGEYTSEEIDQLASTTLHEEFAVLFDNLDCFS